MKMRRDVFVYLSGPITPRNGYTAEQNIEQGLHAHLELLRLGVPNFCPHLAGGFPLAWTIDWETWMQYDLAVITRCTHMLMLPRWETSEGANRERLFAENRQLPIYEDLLTLVRTLGVCVEGV